VNRESLPASQIMDNVNCDTKINISSQAYLRAEMFVSGDSQSTARWWWIFNDHCRDCHNLSVLL